MEIRKVFAANLKRYRSEAKVSQEQLALLAGVDRTYVSSLERCVYSASIDVVDRLATVLGIEASLLLQHVQGGEKTTDESGAASVPDLG